MNPKEISVVPVKNGWLLYVRDPATPGMESPRYVFNDARQMANAIHELVVRGKLGSDEPAFTGTGLPGDPIRAFKPFGQLIAEHQETLCNTPSPSKSILR
jgi:hypothetical protein